MQTKIRLLMAEENTKRTPPSKETIDRITSLKFKPISGQALVDSFPILLETDRSMEVARSVAARLNAAEPKAIMLSPYNQTGRVSVSALKSPTHLKNRVDSEKGPQKIVAGSQSEMGMAIDAMLFQNQTSDSLSEASKLTVDLEVLGLSVNGTPDAVAFDCPVELKTIETLTPGISFMPDALYNFYYQNTPFRNLSSWLMQLGMYQIATTGKGFLVLVSRDTGSVVCYESSYILPVLVQYNHHKWLEESFGFADIIEKIRQINTSKPSSIDDAQVNNEGVQL